MAMRAATMGSMNPVEAPPTVRASDSLFRKLFLLLLLISAAALWIDIWFEQKTLFFPLLLSTFFADASLGIVAGFGSRFILRNRDWALRYLAAFGIVVIGMFMIGALTNWVLGIGPVHLEPKFAEQIHKIRFGPNLWNQILSLRIGSRVLFDFSEMDWADLAHLAVSLAITILSLQAWRRPAALPASLSEPVEVEIEPAPILAPSVTPSRRGRKSSSSSNRRARVRRTSNSSAQLTASPMPQPRVRSNNGSRPSIKKMKEPTLRPKKKRLSHRKPKIQFALVEEHRCPYCLDIVTHKDPRGVKECEVCHTLHHADCWAITGVCQVPHLNT